MEKGYARTREHESGAGQTVPRGGTYERRQKDGGRGQGLQRRAHSDCSRARGTCERGQTAPERPYRALYCGRRARKR